MSSTAVAAASQQAASSSVEGSHQAKRQKRKASDESAESVTSGGAEMQSSEETAAGSEISKSVRLAFRFGVLTYDLSRLFDVLTEHEQISPAHLGFFLMKLLSSSVSRAAGTQPIHIISSPYKVITRDIKGAVTAFSYKKHETIVTPDLADYYWLSHHELGVRIGTDRKSAIFLPKFEFYNNVLLFVRSSSRPYASTSLVGDQFALFVYQILCTNVGDLQYRLAKPISDACLAVMESPDEMLAALQANLAKCVNEEDSMLIAASVRKLYDSLSATHPRSAAFVAQLSILAQENLSDKDKYAEVTRAKRDLGITAAATVWAAHNLPSNPSTAAVVYSSLDGKTQLALTKPDHLAPKTWVLLSKQPASAASAKFLLAGGESVSFLVVPKNTKALYRYGPKDDVNALTEKHKRLVSESNLVAVPSEYLISIFKQVAAAEVVKSARAPVQRSEPIAVAHPIGLD